MAYREAMMTDARKWGEAVFSVSIRMLEAEYQKTDRRDAALQAFAELFPLSEQLCKCLQPCRHLQSCSDSGKSIPEKRQHVLASVICTAAF